MTLNYTKEVMKHFLKPKNSGEIKNADGIGTNANDKCGDIMKVYIKVEDNKIKDAKFQTLGCPSAIASSDVLCELVKGKTLEEAEKFDNKEIVKKLGGLPVIKIHCSVLGAETLKKAIDNYKNKKKGSKFKKFNKE